MSRIALLVVLVGLAVTLCPNAAEAQSGRDAPGARLTLLFETGFGGEAHFDEPGRRDGFDLDPTVGLGVRLAFPVGRYLLIGGHADLLGVEVDILNDRDLVMNFDAYIAFRHLTRLANKPVEFFLGMPLGLSVLFLDDGFDDNDAWPGLNIGVLGGAQMFFGQFGVLAEAGVRHISVYRERRDGDHRIGATQFFLQVGGSLVF